MSTTNYVRELRTDGHSFVHIGNKNVVVQAPKRPETPPKPSSFIPFCRDSHFIERKTILDRMQRACSAPPSRAALVGLGGVGKSQLAIEYAYRVQDSFRQDNKEVWVFWVHAGTRPRVEQGFKAIADAVKIRGRNQPNADILQLVYHWLCNEHNGQWLMVLDSADDVNVFYDISQNGKQAAAAGEVTRTLWTYLPQSSNGSIVITTRNKDLAYRLTDHHKNIIEVGPMDRADALALLETKSGCQLNKASGIELVEALGHIPLAIGQAAAYIQQRAPRASIETYLAKFRENERNQLSLLNYDSGDLRRDPSASNSVVTTWQISFEHIRSQRPTATDLLSLMSFFDCESIQSYLVEPTPQNENRDDRADLDNRNLGSKDSNDAFGESTCEEDTYDDEKEIFDEDIKTLQNYCLISINGGRDTFEMHGLVQLSTRKWLDMNKETERFKIQCISRLARAFPVPEFSNWPACRQLFPHVEQIFRYCTDAKDLQEAEYFEQILYYGGSYSLDQGKYATAEMMIEKALTTVRKVFGTEREGTVCVMRSLAYTYMRMRRWKDAEQLLREALKICEAVLKPDHPVTLSCMSSLALVHIYQGQLDAAELEFTQLIKKEEVLSGPEHLYTPATIHNLALVYSDQKRWQEAEALYMQVIERTKRVLGLEHPNTLASMDSLARAYNDQERWQEARLLLLEVVEGRKRVLGPEHLDTLASMHNLAFMYNGQERWQEAELLYVEVVEGRKRVLGPEHPRTLNGMVSLAFVRKRLGHADEAMELIEQCVQAYIRVLGREHPDTQWSLSFVQGWRSEKSQARESRLKPMVRD